MDGFDKENRQTAQLRKSENWPATIPKAHLQLRRNMAMIINMLEILFLF